MRTSKAQLIVLIFRSKFVYHLTAPLIHNALVTTCAWLANPEEVGEELPKVVLEEVEEVLEVVPKEVAEVVAEEIPLKKIN